MSKDVHLGTPGPPQLRSSVTDQFPGAVVVSATRIFARTLPQGLLRPGRLQHPSGCVARASFSPILLRGGLLSAAGGSAASVPRTLSLRASRHPLELPRERQGEDGAQHKPSRPAQHRTAPGQSSPVRSVPPRAQPSSRAAAASASRPCLAGMALISPAKCTELQGYLGFDESH